MTEPDWAALEAAWAPARQAGVLGRDTIEELNAHAAGYLPAACGVFDQFLGVDLGTGAGVPGVLLALARPSSTWVLVDSSARRCALAQAAVTAMGIADRVTVHHSRAEDVAHDPRWRGNADLVVARSFGPPAEIAECGLPLLAAEGRLVVSVTDETIARWRTGLPAVLPAASIEVHATDAGQYVTIARTGDTPVPDAWPRRPPARVRRPLF